jgi:hypothetical protein
MRITERATELAQRVVPMAAHESGIELVSWDVITMSWDAGDGKIVPVMALLIVYRGVDTEGDAKYLLSWNVINHWHPGLEGMRGVAEQVCSQAKAAYDAKAAEKAAASNGHAPGAGFGLDTAAKDAE